MSSIDNTNRNSIPEDDFDSNSFMTAPKSFYSERSLAFSPKEGEMTSPSKHTGRRQSLKNSNGRTPSDLYLLYLQRRQMQENATLEEIFDNDSFVTASSSFSSNRSFGFSPKEGKMTSPSKHTGRRQSLKNTNGRTPSDLYLLYLQRRQMKDDQDLSYVTDYESKDEIRKAKENLCKTFPSKSLRYTPEKITNQISNVIEYKNFETVQRINDSEQNKSSLFVINTSNIMISNVECASILTCDSSYLLNISQSFDNDDVSCISNDEFDNDNEYPLILPKFEKDSICWKLQRTKSQTSENQQFRQIQSDLSTEDETLSTTMSM